MKVNSLAIQQTIEGIQLLKHMILKCPWVPEVLFGREMPPRSGLVQQVFSKMGDIHLLMQR